MDSKSEANRGVPMKAYFTNGTSSEVRRFTVDEDVSTNVEYLFEKLRSTFPSLRSKPFRVSWKDFEGDDVVISSDAELMEALLEYTRTKNLSDSGIPLPFKLDVSPAEGTNDVTPDAAAGVFVMPENILDPILTACGLKKQEAEENAEEDATEFCRKKYKFGKHHHHHGHRGRGHKHPRSRSRSHSRVSHHGLGSRRFHCRRANTSDAPAGEDQANQAVDAGEHWRRAWRNIMNPVAGRGTCWQESVQEMIPSMLSAGFNLNKIMETIVAIRCGLAAAANGAGAASGERAGRHAPTEGDSPQDGAHSQQRPESESQARAGQQEDAPLLNNLCELMKTFNLNPNENASMEDVMGMLGDFLGGGGRRHGGRGHCRRGNSSGFRRTRRCEKGAGGESENPQQDPMPNAKTTDAAPAEGNPEAPDSKTSGVVVDVDIDDGVPEKSGNGERSAEQSPGAVAAEWTMVDKEPTPEKQDDTAKENGARPKVRYVEIVKESGNLYPDVAEEKKAVENSVTTHPDPKVNKALQTMLDMGFTNEGGWLSNLLEAKNGDIADVLDVLRPYRRMK